MGTGLLLFLSAGAIAVLVRGAGWVVDAASVLARRLGVSEVVIGATVVSLGTTSPEAAVSVMAAWSGEPGLALGNAVGSVIADTGLIFGLGCLLAFVPADRFILRRQGWVQFGSGILLAVICYGALALRGDEAAIVRPVGVFLLALLVVYMIASVRWSRRHPLTGTLGDALPDGERLLRILPLGVLGLLLVLLASRLLICTVSEVAVRWGVPQVVIAATLVAIGTSLPELTVGLTSVVKGRTELLIGNVIGADVLNILFVIGASAVAAPLRVVDPTASIPRIFLYLHLPAMILILALFRVFIHTAVPRGRFRRWNGLPLVIFYAVYVIAQYALSAGR
ncbi:MAG: sodium:calcium antiporter [Candidatus Eisenbacteria bacterium]|nr:sodium:calcium antiporter [Candidatus Eisenbacteria bacterium]